MNAAIIPEDQPPSAGNGMGTGQSRGGDNDAREAYIVTPSPSTEGPVLKNIPLNLIKASRNPRYTTQASHSTSSSGSSASVEADTDLDGLARSLGLEDAPRLAEPPVVEEMPDGHYRLCAGERRVEAARLAGWTGILCLVYPPMDPARAHTLSLVENMHRLPMHPLEEISALCISRLLANADARGVGHEARGFLQAAWDQASSSYSIIQGLDRLLRDAGWIPERPDVTWKAHLDDLGISMAPWERKRKLRMLNIEPALQEQLRELDITEAALRSLGTLEPDDQVRVVEALKVNPLLVRKVRRVARARRDGFYESIEDALAEVQGISRQEPSPASGFGVPRGDIERTTLPYGVTDERAHPLSMVPTSVPTSPSVQEEDLALQGVTVSPDIQDAVLQLLECVDRLSSAMNSLESYSGGTTLPEPWGSWSRDALHFIEGLLPGRGGTGLRSD